MKINKFEDIKVWQLAVALTRDIYELTSKPPFKKDYGLTSQIQRAAVSISSNIVEGFEKNNNNEFIRYLRISKGSCGEVRNHLYLAKEVKHITKEEFEDHHEKTLVLINKIGKFLQYLIKKQKTGEFNKK